MENVYIGSGCLGLFKIIFKFKLATDLNSWLQCVNEVSNFEAHVKFQAYLLLYSRKPRAVSL